MPDVSALIERWQAGDERAAEALYNHHRNSIFRLAYGLLGESADAEEAAQDAFTYALVNIHRYDPDRASFSTWLHTITVSRCRDRHRRRQRRLPSLSLTSWLGRGGDASDPSPGPEGQAIQAERHSQVWESVQALSQPLREAGFALTVATSGPRENVELVLREGELGTFFEAVVTGFDVKKGKPAPDCFLLAAERAGLKPEHCVVVEDAPVGIQAANAAGMPAIGFIGTHPAERLTDASAARVVERLAEITPGMVSDLLGVQ